MPRPVMVMLIMITFFVISFLTNIIGPLIPEILEDFQLSLTLASLLPFAFFIAYGVFSIPSGILIEAHGEKKVMIAAFGTAALGAVLLGLFPTYLMAVCSLFMIGAGMAMLQVAINPLLRVSGGPKHFAFFSVMGQLFFGAASFISPLVYSYLVTSMENPETRDLGIAAFFLSFVPADLPWISLYWVFALTAFVMVILLSVSPFPSVGRASDEQVGPLALHVSLLRDRSVQLFFLGIFAYVGAEQGIANWISQFLSTYHGLDPQTIGARTVSSFWLFMTLGALLGMGLLKVLDSRTVLKLFTVATMIALGIAVFGAADVSRWAFISIGFFISVMWSIIFSLALNSMADHHGSFSGILVTGIIGGAIMPVIVGGLGDWFGLRVGLLSMLIPLGYILSIGFWAEPIITNQRLRSHEE